MQTTTGHSAVLGVLVPCRDEAAVIGRKLANLLVAEWPQAERAHRIVVVDDGSRDESAALARDWGARAGDLGIELEVIANKLRPGKSGALAVGLERLAGQVDLIVLSDADVVLGLQALLSLAEAFARDPELGMACGAQTFVASLASDGSLRAADGGELRPAGGIYDSITALVRGVESRAGRLFSVHGQLLAWRAELELKPTPRLAADDLDLMLQVRLAGRSVRRSAAAHFFEVKTPAGEARAAQELRRARAYLQFLGHPRMAELARQGSLLERLHVALYRHAPLAAPWALPLLLLAIAVAMATLMLQAGGVVALGALAVVVLVLHSSIGRRLASLLAVIRRAKLAESGAPLSDHWETPRA